MFNRYRPKFEYREKNWTSNVFRVLELIFGKPTDLIVENGKEKRVCRIKIESAGFSGIDKYGVRTEYIIAYSTEAKIAFFEQYIRKYISSTLRKLKQFRLPEFKLFDSFIPEYALAGILYIPKTENRPSGYMFAIALDTSANASAGGGSTTVSTSSYTVTGSNTIMMGGIADQANSGGGWNSNVSAFTCNGGSQSLTKITSAYADAGPYGTHTELWGRLSPSSGVVSSTRSNANDAFNISIATYSGVDQGVAIGSLPANSLSEQTLANPQASPAVTSPTNGWVVMSVYLSTSSTATAGSGTFLRQNPAAHAYLFDSNGAVSGSQTLNVAGLSGMKSSFAITAFGPAGGAVANTTNFFMLKMR